MYKRRNHSSVRPLQYRLHLEPDLENLTFSATTEVRLEAGEPVGEVILNLKELAVWSCILEKEGRRSGCPFSVDPATEELTVTLPVRIGGAFTVKIDYQGRINDKMAGFYRSRYRREGRERTLATTQFEERDARRAFPCLDHPLKKATFEVEIVVPETLTAISNMPVAGQKPWGAGKKLVRFRKTPQMSTYLLFFGVGDFTFREHPQTVGRAAASLRAVSVPGGEAHTAFALELARQSLEFCEHSFAIPYALPKLDLIAVPDFAFGAMENWGAITFRENLLLRHPGITSRQGEFRIGEVIAHEVVHQWFGDLVTPRDWKYLWLNESFATYFGFGVLDHYHREWRVWELFLHTRTEPALQRDSLDFTVPIELPGKEQVLINTSTAPIIYSKGGSVLQQLEGYLGGELFGEGLRVFLARHRYACASSEDLWRAFDEVSEKPVTALMKSWIEQEGHPLLRVGRKEGKIRLVQERFLFAANDAAGEQPATAWIVPLKVRIFRPDGSTEQKITLMENPREELEIGAEAAAFKVNDGHTGFYRVLYEQKRDLEELAKLGQEGKLGPEDRWGLQYDLFSLVMAGKAPVMEYLDFLSCYEKEESYLCLASIADNLYHLFLVLQAPEVERVCSLARGLLQRVLSNIGYEPDSGEAPLLSILRDGLLPLAAQFGLEEAAAFGMDRFSSLMRTGSIHPDLMKGVMRIGAMRGGEKAYRWLCDRLDCAESEHERTNILIAMGCFNEPPLIERALELALEKVPSRNRYIPIAAMGENPRAIPLLWEWYTSHLQDLEKMHPIHYERVIAGIVPTAGLDRGKEVQNFFREYLLNHPGAAEVARLSLEELAVNARLRSRST
jgi:aminopeptidase N